MYAKVQVNACRLMQQTHTYQKGGNTSLHYTNEQLPDDLPMNEEGNQHTDDDQAEAEGIW